MSLPFDIPPHLPVLIAGPTASGKSALALEIAHNQGGVIVNADALQVYENWRVLSARPSREDEAKAPHHLYGHVGKEIAYSAGHWLRDVAPFVKKTHENKDEELPRPIIVGGTGLYFSALTEGLVEIPATPDHLREQANERREKDGGHHGLLAELVAQDPETAAQIDQLNPMRVQRAWEVLQATGQGLAAWQAQTPPPLLPLDQCFPIVMEADKDWLNERIARRFDLMIEQGALQEAEANLPNWDPSTPSSKAIGAPELIAYLRGETTLEQARERASISTRQYAKRQRTWFRSRMGNFHKISLPSP